MPHAPQFDTSFCVFAQLLPHFVVPPAQESAQTLFEQTRPPIHVVPHIPQFVGSFVVLTHVLPHFVVPPEHDNAHAPFEQT